MKFSKVFITIIAVIVIVPSMAIAYGGGGGIWTGGVVTAPRFFTVTPTPVVIPTGQVLGVETFRFLINLRQGMRHNDVTELQQRLTDDGFYTGPVTGYFGSLTRAAVVTYQRSHNITPTIGYVGLITRGVLNDTSNGVVLSAEARGSIQTQIDTLLELIQGILAKIANL